MSKHKGKGSSSAKAAKKSVMRAAIESAIEFGYSVTTPVEYQILVQPAANKPPPMRPTEPPTRLDSELNKLRALILDLTNCVWEVERKIRGEPGESVPMKLRIAQRRAQRSLDLLKEAGFRIKDYKVGEPYPGGSSGLKVHLQPMPGATKETISDTVSPTIYYQDHPIQMGEVWVSIPAENFSDEASADASPAQSPDVSTGSGDATDSAASPINGDGDGTADPKTGDAS